MANRLNLTLLLTAVDRMSPVVGKAARSSMAAMRVMQQDAQRKSARAREQMFDSGMAAAAGAAALAYPLKMAANYEMLRIRMQVLTGSQKEGNAVFEKTIQLAAKTPLTLDQVGVATARLVGFGRTAQEALVDVKMLGDVVTIAGGDIQAAMVAYGQAAGEGRVMTRDLTQFVNSGVPIFKMLQEATGKNTIELKKMAEQGKLSFEILEQAFEKATSAGGQFENGMEKSSKTAVGLFNRLIDEAGRLAKVFGDSILPSVKWLGEAMIPLLDVTAAFFKENKLLTQAMMWTVVGYTALAAGAMAYAGWQFISNTMAGAFMITALKIPFKPLIWGFSHLASLVRLFAWSTAMANGFSLTAIKIFLTGLVPSLTAAATAAWGFAAAMLANPITLVVVGVIALGAALVAVSVKWKEWGAALGFVMGPLGWMVNIFRSIREHWTSITDAFSEGGFLSGIIAVGKAIMDGILYPLQQLMSVIHSITGFDWAKNAESAILGVRAKVGIDTDSLTTASAVAPNQTAQAQTSTINQISPNATAQGRTELNYSPTISIGSGATEAERESFMRILEQHKEEMFRMFKEEQRLADRRSFA